MPCREMLPEQATPRKLLEERGGALRPSQNTGKQNKSCPMAAGKSKEGFLVATTPSKYILGGVLQHRLVEDGVNSS